MSCERHKKALIDAALSNDLLPLDLRAHLDSCGTCRAALDEGRRLLAAIDSGLRAAANAPVPPSLLPAVHLRLAQEDATSAKCPPSSSWMYLAAAAALILALIPLLRPRRANETGAQSSTQVAEQSTERASVAIPQPQPSSALEHPVNRRFYPQSRLILARAAQSPQPEVLVPPEERVALARYIASASQRKSWVTVARIPPAEPATQPLTIEPLNIAALNEQSLEELDRHRDRETQIR
jgi:hypothetical protein